MATTIQTRRPTPYYSDDTVSLYLGDMREVLPALDLTALDLTADCVVADPPYEETSLAWDRWPDGWLEVAANVTSSLWCFGSIRLFGERWREFGNAGWKLSQDLATEWETEAADHVTWEKHNGSGFAADRFKRVHETVTHWYRARWAGIYHDVPRVAWHGAVNKGGKSRGLTPHTGRIGGKDYVDDGARLMRSVIRVRSMQGRAIHPSEKPIGILDPLIRYACPPGGLVVDPFAGSGSSLVATRLSGRRALGVEANEEYAERAARRLAQATLEVS
jgi:site-specific DNA-methyltransferase (adenine-specific)